MQQRKKNTTKKRKKNVRIQKLETSTLIRSYSFNQLRYGIDMQTHLNRVPSDSPSTTPRVQYVLVAKNASKSKVYSRLHTFHFLTYYPLHDNPVHIQLAQL